MLEQATPVRLLYTAALGGRIDWLPRLSTFIKQERSAASGITLLVDLGMSCAPGQWICEATGGRGMLVAMDALGYDAFHIGPRDMLYTQPALVNQIREIIATPLAAGPWMGRVSRRGLAITLINAVNLPRAALELARSSAPPDLVVALCLGEGIEISPEWHTPLRVLMLDGGAPEGDPALGRIDMVLLPEAPYIVLDQQTRMALTPAFVGGFSPDPTMISVIEFVQREAHYAEHKRGGT